MKCSEIVEHLWRYLPRVSDSFTEYRNPDSVTVIGSTVTIQMASHGMKDGQPVCISHSAVRNLVSTIETVSDGVKITTTTPHNLTEGWYESDSANLSSVSNPNVNGDYDVVRVVNFYSFVIDALADTGLSDLYVNEPIDYGIDGLYNITKINDNSFSFELDFGETIPVDFALDVVPSTVRVHTSMRISGTNDIRRVQKSYEKTPPSKMWLIVELGGFFPSKSNRAQTDATNEQGGASTWFIPLHQPFTLYVIVPCSKHTGRDARDDIEDERLKIYKSICGSKFSSGLSAGTISAVTPESDGDSFYNVEYYMYAFSFSQTSRLTNNDRLFSSRTTPFRNVTIDFYPEDTDNDNVIMELSADLDD